MCLRTCTSGLAGLQLGFLEEGCLRRCRHLLPLFSQLPPVWLKRLPKAPLLVPVDPLVGMGGGRRPRWLQLYGCDLPVAPRRSY
eukprot:scaffold3181_cov389-Prasinococcus_capsulatus_cf.AAC.14